MKSFRKASEISKSTIHRWWTSLHCRQRNKIQRRKTSKRTIYMTKVKTFADDRFVIKLGWSNGMVQGTRSHGTHFWMHSKSWVQTISKKTSQVRIHWSNNQWNIFYRYLYCKTFRIQEYFEDHQWEFVVLSRLHSGTKHECRKNIGVDQNNVHSSINAGTDIK